MKKKRRVSRNRRKFLSQSLVILVVLLVIVLYLLFNQLNAQNTTYVPDNNFENYLETHNSSGAIVPLGDPTSMGDGILNDSVLTSNIINVNLLFKWRYF